MRLWALQNGDNGEGMNEVKHTLASYIGVFMYQHREEESVWESVEYS